MMVTLKNVQKSKWKNKLNKSKFNDPYIPKLNYFCAMILFQTT